MKVIYDQKVEPKTWKPYNITIEVDSPEDHDRLREITCANVRIPLALHPDNKQGQLVVKETLNMLHQAVVQGQKGNQ